MTQSPSDDTPGFLADTPEHCSACQQLIRAGQTCYLTIEEDVLCADCALNDSLIRVRGDLAVEVRSDRLVVRRGGGVGRDASH